MVGPGGGQGGGVRGCVEEERGGCAVPPDWSEVVLCGERGVSFLRGSAPGDVTLCTVESFH